MDNLVLKLSGHEYMSQSLSNINSIFEKVYLVLTDKKRMTDKDREEYKLVAKEIREGSMIIDIGMVITAIQQSNLLSSLTLNPSDIWSIIQTATSTLLSILQANSKGEAVVITGDNNKVIPFEAFEVMKRIEPHVERLSQLINPSKGFESIKLGPGIDESSTLKIDEESKRLFKAKTNLEEKVIIANVNFYKIDTQSGTGSLVINNSNDEVIEVGSKYEFDFLLKPTVEEYGLLIAQNKTVNFLKQVRFDSTTGMNKILRLKVINIDY